MDFNISSELFILIITVIAAIVIIFILIQWGKVSQSKKSVELLEKEIELKKMSMVEKDLESKRIMENPIPIPKDQEESLKAIRESTNKVRGEVGFLHNEINERLARLEAQTEQKKLENLLKEIERKEKTLK